MDLTFLWASGREDFPLELTWVQTQFPKTLLDESINQGLGSAHMHSIAQVQKIWRSCPRHLNGSNKNTPSMLYPPRWNVITSMVTHTKISPTMVNPRDTAGNTENEEEEPLWSFAKSRDTEMFKTPFMLFLDEKESLSFLFFFCQDPTCNMESIFTLYHGKCGKFSTCISVKSGTLWTRQGIHPYHKRCGRLLSPVIVWSGRFSSSFLGEVEILCSYVRERLYSCLEENKIFIIIQEEAASFCSHDLRKKFILVLKETVFHPLPQKPSFQP